MNEIKLNVGGVLYSTTLQTLRKYDGSMFGRMFDEVWLKNIPAKDAEPIFIDRNGSLFCYILNFLRDGSNVVLPSDSETLRSLLNEAKYFLLDELVHMITVNLDGQTAHANIKEGSTIRFRKDVIEVYLKSLVQSLIENRRQPAICGTCKFRPQCNDVVVICLHCRTEEWYTYLTPTPENESAIKHFLLITKFKVLKILPGETCCILSLNSIHIPIGNLELIE